MESMYLAIVGILFFLAISDLIVGVSNDAVNFLNSAIGSKAASFKMIIFTAALGVALGATFSSGMMEVTRNGIFHPQMFYFSEIMVIYFAVMITDVILLDTFNTFGMPTSTTVSIVFELFGAAVGISLLKVDSGSGLDISNYINTGSALVIILGILLSIVIAFVVGAIIQYLVRLIFSFNYQSAVKKYGAIWGGISITAIIYFILIKGMKGSTYASYDMGDGIVLNDWVQVHALMIIGVCFIIWTILLQLLNWIFNINITKIIVLVGTFALAMAFVGNDLVNFIGVPLAGYASYLQFVSNSGVDPDAMLMTGLASEVEIPYYFLLIAGAIMVATLYFNKKAKKVIQTSINLSRQDVGEERFESTLFSKMIVRSFININTSVSKALPNNFKSLIRKQFDVSRASELTVEGEKPSFDMLRASVNLVVASILISFATSLKLPLSTTYVTFMVAMGTSLADNAWGRESAVYRISGVISVIMGWFLTAIIAFTVAFVIAILTKLGGVAVIFIFISIAAYSVFRSHLSVKSKDESEEEFLPEVIFDEKITLDSDDLFNDSKLSSSSALEIVSNIYFHMVHGLSFEDRKELNKTLKKARRFNNDVKKAKDNVKNILPKIDEQSIECAQHYTLVLDSLRDLGNSIHFICLPAFNHVDNNLKPISEFHKEHLSSIAESVEEICNRSKHIIMEKNFDEIEILIQDSMVFISKMDDSVIEQLKRLKKNKSSSKSSKLFLDIISETKTMILNIAGLIKTVRDLNIDVDNKR
jgi:phosphate/sulfate permease